MAKVEISESAYLKQPKEPEENEIGETYEDKGYKQIPIDQINLNTEPISIINDFSHSFIDSNIKSYIKVFLGFAVFVILLLLISILSGHFHYEKPEINHNNNNNNIINNANNNNDKNKKGNNDNKLLNLRRLYSNEISININYDNHKFDDRNDIE